MTPATSIVLTTYDRAALLPRSIASVLAQSDGDFELIVVDDGSTDETASVLARIGDPRIRSIALARNRGLPAARNVGLSEARGRYVAFQDSDDEWMPEKLARQRRVLEQHADVGVVYADMHRVCADGRLLYHRSPTIVRGRLVDPATRWWQSYMLAMQPVLMRRECLADVRFDERLVRFEDLDLHVRVARRHAYRHVAEPLVRYHETGGMTVDWRAELRGRRQLLWKYAGELARREPTFLVRETVDVLLRRSLLPIVARHVTPV